MMNQLLREILTSRVYEVARETPLDPAPRLSQRIGNGVLLKGRSPLSDYNRVVHASNGQPLTFPLVVLVDGDTASSAEIVPSAVSVTCGIRSRAIVDDQTLIGLRPSCRRNSL